MKKILILFIVAAITMTAGCSKFSIEDKKAAKYLLPSDKQVITEVDLSKLNDVQLKYAKEEVYARHGKIFNDDNLAKYFNSQDWYQPDPSFSDKTLSEIEIENANYINQYIAEQAANNQPAPAATNPPQTQPPIPASNAAAAGSVIVIHDDEDYYYKNYWGDNSYIIPDSNVRRLNADELKYLSSVTLALIRNEIYAREGYVFQKEKYRNYFGSKAWYHPNPDFNESWLNSVEKDNIKLIKSME